jgi:hypothetical protein
MHDEGAGEEIKIHAIFYNDVWSRVLQYRC